MKSSRIHIIFFLFLIGALGLIGRLFALQVYDYGTFAAFARGQQQVFLDVDPERGSIFAGGANAEPVVLAANRALPNVFAVPRDIEDLDGAVEMLISVLQLEGEGEEDALKERLDKPDDPYEPIADKITQEQATLIREADIAGIVVRDERTRTYPQGSRLAHVLGFIGFDALSERRGVYGLEAAYEQELYGVPGKLRGERDGQGRLLEYTTPPLSTARPGADLILTIDPNIQYQTEKYLGEAAEKYQISGGSIIVLEVKSGAIRALANVPTFDPNYYSEVDDIGVYTNSAISAAYEPGSIFKPITMAAALDSGALLPESTYENIGPVKISGYTISNVLDNYDNQVLSMIDVLRHSLNTGVIFAQKETGQETFLEYLQSFGFGERTGIELPGEASGSIANLFTGREINYATAAFGQGISVTPLQMVAAIGAIANAGTLMEPYIVDRIEYPDGTVDVREPSVVRDVISSKTATRLAAMMTRVVDDGGGYMAQIPGYRIAGKTGTAQIAKIGSAGYEGEYIHSFVGFFPAFDAEYVILTKLDRPVGARYSSVSAAPLFKRVAEYLITYAAIPPDRPDAN